jgi:SAM-dependent methyltransferase
MKNILPADKNVSILDIGCGYGQMLVNLKRDGYTDLYGIDISQDAVDFCNRQGLNVSAVEDIVAYFSDKKYDLIVMSHVLEHIEKSRIIETVKHIKNHLLKPGGHFLLMVPNAQSNTGAYWMYEDFTHHTLFTTGSVNFVLKAAGFNNIEFLDKDGVVSAGSWYGKLIRTVFLKIYDWNRLFWNKITLSDYYKKSPRIYTFELKAYAS